MRWREAATAPDGAASDADGAPVSSPASPRASPPASPTPPLSTASFDVYSVATNPPSGSSYDASARALAHREIATRFFGPMSLSRTIEPREENEEDAWTLSSRSDGGERRPGIKRPRTTSEPALPLAATAEEVARESEDATAAHRQASVPEDELRRETPEQRARRRSNCERFDDIVHLANTRQPVQFDLFREHSSHRRRRKVSALSSQALDDPGRRKSFNSGSDVDSGREDEEDDDGDQRSDEMDDRINTELLEAYIAYSKSIGHEPNIQLEFDSSGSDKDDDDELTANRMSFVQHRPVVEEKQHLWTGAIGTRHSKRRGCVQFWIWLAIGIVVVVILGVSLSNLKLNEVLHLDAFIENDVVVTEDYTYLYLQDEVNFHLKYDLQAATNTGTNDSHFMVLLMTDDEFEDYVEGDDFTYMAKGSTLRTTYASLPLTYIDDVVDEMYMVIQPCVLARNPTADYCQTSRLPTPVSSRQKVYNLGQNKFMLKHQGPNYFPFHYMYVNPMPDKCYESGFQGAAYLLIFIPYLIVLTFGLRLMQMIYRCESFRKSLERAYNKEFDVPEDEVDYWQPMPWDRKVPKTKLLGPCCWKKFRRPFEPFYTWWRHENYFTWVFFPYRNERLSRSERAIIVACSLYITFYVLFLIVMIRDSYGANISLFTSVVMYAVLISILPSAGKAIFKELFKLIFRQRRKYFRAKAAGGDVSQFSFRLAFLLQVFVAILITLTQLPMFYIWVRRSCLFLYKFMYFGVLAAVMRLSIMGLVQDYVWYILLKTWGWKDLCPYCTERIAHCDCFNDELLVLSVERVGPKWELILVLDRLLAKAKQYEPQFELYTADQLRERWEVIVERAEKHMEKIDKLLAYREKKRRDRHQRSQKNRRSFVEMLGIRDETRKSTQGHEEGELRPEGNDRPTRFTDDNSDTSTDSTADSDIDCKVCSLREKKILAVNAQVHLERFEKHYDSTIVDVFRSLGHAVTRHRPRDRQDHGSAQSPASSVTPSGYGEDGQTQTLADDHARLRGASRRGDSRSQPVETQAAGGGDREGSPSGSSEGETMWVFDTPAERLARREREKLQRKRAFRVLQDYEIESVEVQHDEHGNVVYASASGTSTPILAQTPPLSTSRVLHRIDSKHRPLLPRQRSAPTEEDIVVLPHNDELAITVVDDNYVDESSSDEAKPADDQDLEIADHNTSRSRLNQPPESNVSRTYSVVPRHPNLMRRVSSSAAAFASWAFKYDQNPEY